MKKSLKPAIAIAVIVVIIIGLIALVINLLPSHNKSVYNFVIVQKGDIRQEIAVSGKVQPAQNFNLAFEIGGRVAKIYAKVNDQVKAGQVLVSLDSGTYSAQLEQAQAGVQAEQANLQALKNGARPEDIALSQAQVKSTQQSLQDAQIQANANLDSAYSAAALAAAQDAIVGKNSLMTLTNIQLAHFLNPGPDRNIDEIATAKEGALVSLLGATGDSGEWSNLLITNLVGGAYGDAQAAVRNPNHDKIDQVLAETIDGLQKVRTALNIIPITYDVTNDEKLSLITEKGNIAGALADVTARQQAIAVQKTANASAIAAAQAAYDNANNALTLKQAGATADQIEAEQARLKAAQASVDNLNAVLAKTVIRAPIDGIIITQNAKVGEIMPPAAPVVSLNSQANFEVETYVSEADIAKVKVGSAASVTLDAYGNQTFFEAVVTAINPAETVVNGFPTYKTTLQFTKPDDRIKSGMTANVEIVTETKTGVLYIPFSAIISREADKFVLVNIGQSNPEQRKIEIGITGDGSRTEVISGLKEGDQIVDFGNSINN